MIYDTNGNEISSDRKSENRKGYKIYCNIHRHISTYRVRNNKCDHCGVEKKCHFAIKRGLNYSRNIDDYLELCPKCHKIYDLPDDISERMKYVCSFLNKEKRLERLKDYNLKNTISGPDHVRNKSIESFNLKTGELIKKYYATIQAQKEDKFNANSICAALKGKQKSSGGLGWRYSR